MFRGEAVKGVAGVKQRWLSPEKGLELMKAGGKYFPASSAFYPYDVDYDNVK